MVREPRSLLPRINQCLCTAHRAYSTVMSSKGLDIFAGGSRAPTDSQVIPTYITPLSTRVSFCQAPNPRGFCFFHFLLRSQGIRAYRLTALRTDTRRECLARATRRNAAHRFR